MCVILSIEDTNIFYLIKVYPSTDGYIRVEGRAVDGWECFFFFKVGEGKKGGMGWI
jgi:hypothetical protein